MEVRYGQVITIQGYFDGLKSVKEQVREDSTTNQEDLLKDVIKCLEVLKGDTPELTIKIIKKNGEPAIIQKTYTVSKSAS